MVGQDQRHLTYNLRGDDFYPELKVKFGTTLVHSNILPFKHLQYCHVYVANGEYLKDGDAGLIVSPCRRYHLDEALD